MKLPTMIATLHRTTSPSPPSTGEVPPGSSIAAKPVIPTATPANVQREGRSPARSRKMMIHNGITETKSAVIPEGTKRSAIDTVPMPTPRSAIPIVAALRS